MDSALDGGESSASHPGRFNSGEWVAGTKSIGDWVGHRVSLDDVEKRKILHCRDSSPACRYIDIFRQILFSELLLLFPQLGRVSGTGGHIYRQAKQTWKNTSVIIGAKSECTRHMFIVSRDRVTIQLQTTRHYTLQITIPHRIVFSVTILAAVTW
jgi:hypothetical protein